MILSGKFLSEMELCKIHPRGRSSFLRSNSCRKRLSSERLPDGIFSYQKFQLRWTYVAVKIFKNGMMVIFGISTYSLRNVFLLNKLFFYFWQVWSSKSGNNVLSKISLSVALSSSADLTKLGRSNIKTLFCLSRKRGILNRTFQFGNWVLVQEPASEESF
jgi:hypothetical protein